MDDPQSSNPGEPGSRSTRRAVVVRRVSVDDVDAWDHNPRVVRNEAWEEIKSSLLASENGLEEPLFVVSRPDTDRLMVSKGGNTRLNLVRECREQTPEDDTRFDTLLIIETAYTSELDIAASHDIENNHRGDWVFYERSRARHHQFLSYQKEFGEDVTHAQFIRHMQDVYGIKIDKGSLSRSFWVIDFLQDLLPHCLAEGRMSERQVKDLQRFIAAVRRVWLDRAAGSGEQFEFVIGELLRRQNREHQTILEAAAGGPVDVQVFSVDFEQLVDDLAREIEVGIDDEGVSLGLARTWIARALSGRSEAAAADPVYTDASAERRAGGPPSECSELTAQQPEGESFQQEEPGATNDDTFRDDEQEGSPPTLEQLRFRSYSIASEIAERCLSPEIIVRIPDGYGFLLADVLEDEEPADDDEAKRMRSAAWWALAMGGGVLTAPIEVIRESLPLHSMIRQSMEQRSSELLTRTAAGNDPEPSLRLINDLSDADFDAFSELFALRRQIHHTATRPGNLWRS